MIFADYVTPIAMDFLLGGKQIRIASEVQRGSLRSHRRAGESRFDGGS